MSILDTYLDKVYQRLRYELDFEQLQEKADTYDNLMNSMIRCPNCGDTIGFAEEEDD